MTWIKLMFSEIGGFLKPFLSVFLSGIGPVLVESASTAVRIVAQSAVDGEAGDDKRARAQKIVINNLRKQGIELGAQVTISMINAAIEAAVQGVKTK